MNFGESSSILRDILPSCLLQMAKVEYYSHLFFTTRLSVLSDITPFQVANCNVT
jgi:hypothetical protein